MHQHRVISESDPSLPFIQALYESSFPLAERREWKQLLSMLYEPHMELLLVKDENISVGFIILWRLDPWIYIEHVAVDSPLQGKGYGKQIIADLIAQTKNIILETTFHDEGSERRIKFYEQLGFKIASYLYNQPPYRAGEPTIPMHIMTTAEIVDASTFSNVTGEIREKVYERS